MFDNKLTLLGGGGGHATFSLSGWLVGLYDTQSRAHLVIKLISHSHFKECNCSEHLPPVLSFVQLDEKIFTAIFKQDPPKDGIGQE